jgi:hypothetical protein
LGNLDNVEERQYQSRKTELKQGQINIQPARSNFKLDDDTLTFTNDSSSFRLDETGLDYNISPSSRLTVGPRRLFLGEENAALSMNSGSITLSAAKQLWLLGSSGIELATKGSVFITGGLYDSNAKGLDQWGSIDRFIVKCTSFVLDSANETQFAVGALRINAGSGMIMGNNKPGGGSTQAFSLGVAQGDANISLSAGNLDIAALGPGYYVKIIGGQEPVQGYLKVTMDEVLLKSMPVECSISLQGGSITLKSKVDTMIDSTATVSIKSKAKTSIESDANVEITTKATMTVDAKANMEIKAATLKMTDAKMIDAGQKTVVPTGTGPFCAIQTCPLFGIMHSGSQASG